MYLCQGHRCGEFALSRLHLFVSLIAISKSYARIGLNLSSTDAQASIVLGIGLDLLDRDPWLS